jgi:plastocyanin
MQRLFLSLGLVVLAVVVTACSGASAAPATDAPAPASPAGDEIVVVARDLAFQTTALELPAGEPTTIVLDNQDGAPHNIAIKDASGVDVFTGEIVSQSSVANAIPALSAGTYTFLCEVHPNMQGTITVR